MKTVKLISVFISCPGDMKRIRDLLVSSANEINMNLRQEDVPVRLESVHMDNAVFSGTGSSGQAVIDQQIGQFDVYIGLMKSKFGTAVGKFGSGTEHEYDIAKRAKVDGLCSEVGFLFDPDNTPPGGLEPEALIKFGQDLAKVRSFKNAIHADGVLTYDCPNDSEFDRHFRGLINNVIKDVKKGLSPQAMAENSMKTILSSKNADKE